MVSGSTSMTMAWTPPPVRADGGHMVGGDLGEDGEMPLPLGADAGGDADLAARLHLDLGALIGADPGALDVARNADADAAALRLQARLLLLDETVIADELQRPFQDRGVIAAVVGEPGEVLVDDLVVVGERVRRNEIAAADLRAVE